MNCETHKTQDAWNMMKEPATRTSTDFRRYHQPAKGMEQLTPREREILILLAQGCYYREIGETLGISTSTVRAHLHSVYKKLGVNSRAQAVIKFHGHNRQRQNRRTNGSKTVPDKSRKTSTLSCNQPGLIQ
jgi:DNA-binding CsgD family transcriptional regulator